VLTVDLVQTYRRDDRLFVRRLNRDLLTRASTLAKAYIAIAESHLGKPQEVFDAACKAVEVRARDKKLAAGLLKLVKDRCTFEMAIDLDPVSLRQAVFREASRVRQSAAVTEDFDREQILTCVGDLFDIDGDTADHALFSDLRSAHTLQTFDPISSEKLIVQYQRAQEQAVLLKATRVVVEIEPMSAPLLRRLFHRLKFLRLLFRIQPLSNQAFCITLDGPFSLFSSVTKYGLQLALVIPALDACGKWRLSAEVIWGKEKRRMQFSLKGRGDFVEADDTSGQILSDDVQQLISRFESLGADWSIAPATDILEVPGKEICVPDIVFTHALTGEVVYLEVMGFWSREAVWRRVELVEAGLNAHIIFAVSKRLRVSEAILDEDLPGILYIYKGVMNAAKIARLLDEKFFDQDLTQKEKS
jgi:uncharacterized protein